MGEEGGREGGRERGREGGREGATYLRLGLCVMLGCHALDKSREEVFDCRVSEGLGGLRGDIAIKEITGWVLNEEGGRGRREGMWGREM